MEDAEQVLRLHSRATVTSYGTRRSSKTPGNSSDATDDKENTTGSENKVYNYTLQYKSAFSSISNIFMLA